MKHGELSLKVKFCQILLKHQESVASQLINNLPVVNEPRPLQFSAWRMASLSR